MDSPRPAHEHGIALREPGLYFVGLNFLYALSSTMIHGVGRDAERVAGTIADRLRARGDAEAPARIPPSRERDPAERARDDAVSGPARGDVDVRP